MDIDRWAYLRVPCRAKSARLRAAIICAALLLPVPDACALWDDRLELFVAASVTRDDNVFRISDRSDPLTVVGSSYRGDRYTTTSPGFNLDVPVSRQRFAGGVKWNFTRYDRFTILDFDGHEGRVAWHWQIGDDWSGQLGYTETLALASLANSRAGILSGTPNSLETRRSFFGAAYRLTPRWQLRADASRLEQFNGLPELTLNDIVIESAELGVNYITPAKNQLGLVARAEEGRYPNRPGALANLPGDDYTQTGGEFVGGYSLSGHSRLSVRAGWVSRSHARLAQRDFEEGTFHATHDWQATGKLAVSTIAKREISPLDDTYSTFVLLTGVVLNPTLRLTEKLSATANLEYSERDYLDSPPSRTDWVRTAALKISYRPLRPVVLEMTLLRQTRSSTVAFGDYEVTVGSMTIRIGL